MSKAISIDSITPAQWTEIKRYAISAKSVTGDEFKATVWGFVFWLLKHDLTIEVDIGDGTEVKH